MLRSGEKKDAHMHFRRIFLRNSAGAECRALREQLAAERKLLRTLIDSIPDHIFIKDVHSRFVVANVAAARGIGMASPDELVGKTDIDLFPEESGTRFFSDEQALMHSGMPLIDQVELNVNREGIRRWFSTTKIPIFDDDGKLRGLTGVCRDVTGRIHTEEMLRLRNRALESSIDAIVIVNCQNTDFLIEYANPACSRLTGHSHHETLGNNIWSLLGTEAEQSEIDTLTAAVRNGEDQRITLRNYRRDRTQFWNEIHVAPVLDKNDAITHFVCIMNDVTDAKQLEEKLEQLASYDALTGLPNRRLFLSRLEQSLALAARGDYVVGIAYFDLDRFKFINDSLGHAAGDELLTTVAARVAACLRKSDTVARLGGDEFAMILPVQHGSFFEGSVTELNADIPDTRSGVIELLNRIQREIARPISLSGESISVTSSMGACFYPHDAKEGAVLLQSADAAMYAAKGKGRAQIHFHTAAMNSIMAQHRRFENELAGALDRAEFSIVAVPIENLASGNLYGVQLRLQWNRPERAVAHEDFYPLLERHGMATSTERCLIRQAYLAWTQLGPTVQPAPRLSIAISRCHFAQNDFVQWLAENLRGDNGHAFSIDLEFEEKYILKNPELYLERMRLVRELGIGVTVNNFGSESWSLRYLASLPASSVRVSIEQLGTGGSALEQYGTFGMIAAIARQAKIHTIGYGVDTAEQAGRLRAIGWLAGQGAFTGPMPALPGLDKLLVPKF